MFTDEFEGTSAGQCHCKENVGGVRCDGCKNGYWNFTLENEMGCQGKSHLYLVHDINSPIHQSTICFIEIFISLLFFLD